MQTKTLTAEQQKQLGQLAQSAAEAVHQFDQAAQGAGVMLKGQSFDATLSALTLIRFKAEREQLTVWNA